MSVTRAVFFQEIWKYSQLQITTILFSTLMSLKWVAVSYEFMRQHEHFFWN